MKITASVGQMMIPEVDALGHLFRSLGGTNKMVAGSVVYTLDSAGEQYLSSEAYGILKDKGLLVEGATLYTKMDTMDTDVPVGFEDSYTVDEDGAKVPRTWADYAPFHWELEDGSYLVRCVHVKAGHTSSKGLDNAERLVWEDNFTLLVKAEGEVLIPKSEGDV